MYRIALSCLVPYFVISGCSAPRRGPAVPREIQDRAVVAGMTPVIRTWGSGVNPDFRDDLIESIKREKAHLDQSGHTGPIPRADYLAISGGGSYGAYGAGLLAGWAKNGTRPTFKAVTGISTGALTAPFAFLGPKYDSVLKKVYTGVTTEDIMEQRGILAAVTDDALTDNAPLWRLLRHYVTQEVLDEIAAEHRKGRILVIGTTNIDARRAVLWNIGAIANSGNPNALELLQKIMIASAAIPAVFPPVMFDVEVDGKQFQEMHVDGGAMTQVFLYPPSFRVKDVAAAAGVQRDRRVYIIRNGRLDADWAETERRTLSIAGRAISSLLHSQGIGDLFRIYMDAQRDGLDYRLEFIPADFDMEETEAFDQPFMKALYEVGYQRGLNGGHWQNEPPFLQTEP